jgi:hypothetical protein
MIVLNDHGVVQKNWIGPLTAEVSKEISSFFNIPGSPPVQL